MAQLTSIVARPAENVFDPDEVIRAANRWLNGNSDKCALFERFLRSTGIRERRYALTLEEILALSGQSERALLFTSRGEPLLESVIRTALDRAHLAAREIDSVVFTSCTSPMIPAIDSSLLPALGFRTTVNRLPIYQYGCAGGVAGMAIADRFANAGAKTLLVSLELCSLLFHPDQCDTVSLLGAALFADGASAAVLVPGSSGLCVTATQSFLIPDTTRLMGYDIRDDGHHLRLEKELPSVVQNQIGQIVGDFLAKHSLRVSDIPWWLIHPGGMKILDGVQELFGLATEQFHWSEEVLRNVGNVSSSTVLFVLSSFIESNVMKRGEPALMVGIGPGLTIELILFRQR